MYHQTNPTETFRERQLVLRQEAENWRLARRLRAGGEMKARSTVAMSILGLLAALMIASLVLAASSSPAHAASTTTPIVVNSNLDLDDLNTADGVCDVTASFEDTCTLRAAIQEANASPGADVIDFNIPESFRDPNTGVATIRPSPTLPNITEAVTIDGYSQPEATENALAKGTNAKIMIELRNGEPTRVGAGLIANAPNVVIKGLDIQGFLVGISVFASDGRSTEGVKIQGNFIGTDPTGTQGLRNEDGVFVGLGSSGVTIGGTSPATRNLISDNIFVGVSIIDSSNIKVLGNLIGANPDGKSALGNTGSGVEIARTTNTLVGGTTSASANTIAFNTEGGDGVAIVGDTCTNIRVLRNSIFGNDGLGIDLLDTNENGFTNISNPNDAGDKDVGANGLQNKPNIASAVTSGAKSTIKGRLSTKANKTFVVRFFENPSGTNEGKTFIGQKKVTTSKDGKVSFTFSPAQKVGVSKTVTATATGSEGTSEFSAPRKVVAS